MADRNRGERLKSAILAPEARPIWLGNDLEAANKDEKYLNIVEDFFKKKEGHIMRQNLRKHSAKASQREAENETIERCLRGTRKIARSVVDFKCKNTESTGEKTSGDE
jgi:hypothetical protein